MVLDGLKYCGLLRGEPHMHELTAQKRPLRGRTRAFLVRPRIPHIPMLCATSPLAARCCVAPMPQALSGSSELPFRLSLQTFMQAGACHASGESSSQVSGSLEGPATAVGAWPCVPRRALLGLRGLSSASGGGKELPRACFGRPLGQRPAIVAGTHPLPCISQGTRTALMELLSSLPHKTLKLSFGM